LLRFTYLGLLSAALLITIAVALLRGSAGPISNSQRLTGYIFAATAVLWGVWVASLFLMPSGEIKPLAGNDIQAVIMIFGFGMGMLACIGFFLMIWERVEDDLIESEGKFRALAEKSNVGIYLVQNHRFKYVNLIFSETLGYDRHEMINSLRPEDIIFPDDRCLVERFLTTRASSEKPVPYIEFRVLTKEGQTRQVEAYNTKTIYRGKPAHIGTVVDITERKRLEEERQELTERLNQSEKMEALGLLAGSVAHDLNNVLGALIGYSEILFLKTEKKSSSIKYITNIIKSGERGAAIVNDLLTLARRGIPIAEITNLNDVIREYQKTLEYERLCAFHPNVRISLRLAADLPNIIGSPVHLGKMIMNLVSNGVEAMPRGGVLTIQTLRKRLEAPLSGYERVSEGDYSALIVHDEGIGISDKDIKRIFEPFFTKKTLGRSGTGLGLTVVWGTVKDHKGYIDVQSHPGKGAIFTLYFPTTEKSAAEKPDARPLSDYRGSKETILVVDDVAEQCEMAADMLAELNYTVATAVGGEAALDYLKEHTVDLILLDMIMDPGMDGLDTYREICKRRASQKVILMSGYAETDRVKEARMLGAGAFISKPYVMERLGHEIRKELARKS
jgi:PAS domain S-box-containing protein